MVGPLKLLTFSAHFISIPIHLLYDIIIMFVKGS